MAARRRISASTPGPVTFAAEDSHSGLVRTLGKRVGGNASRVRIPHPPPLRSAGTVLEPVEVAVSYMSRPILSSRQRRVERNNRLRAVIPFLVVFLIGFGLAWLVKPGAKAVDPTTGCRYVSVIPAKVLPKPSQITVNVYNSTKRVGLAAITAIDLKTRGFKGGIVGSSKDNIRGIGEIRYGSGSRAAAERVAAYAPGTLLKHDPTKKPGDASIDLVLGEAFGQLAPDAQVQVILAIPSAQAVGKGCPQL